MRDVLEQIARLAEGHRAVRLGYRRPGEAAATEYVAEPYRVQRTPAGPAVHAWQLSPSEGRAAGWRDFRLDRITAVADAGQTFRPRMPVTLGRESGSSSEAADATPPAAPPATGQPLPDALRPATPLATGVLTSAGTAAGDSPAPAAAAAAHESHWWGEQRIAAVGPTEQYFQYLETAMLDGNVTPDEMSNARSLGDRVETHERKAVHARVFASVLGEVLQDARISHREELYLKNVRQFLDQLGWAP